jgi:O-antigen/teichoic acid export membrane protein
MTAKRSYGLFIGNAFYAGLSFLSIALLSHVLLPEDYGNLRYAMGIATVLSSLISLGFSQAIYYFLNNQAEEKAASWIMVNRLSMFMLSILIIAMSFFAYPFMFSNSIDQYQLMPVLGFMAFTALCSCDLNILLHFQRAWSYFLAAFLMFVLRILGFYWAYSTAQSMVVFWLILLVTQAFFFLFNQVVIQNQLRGYPMRIKSSMFMAMWKYSWPIGLAFVTGLLLTQTDRLLMMNFFGSAKEIAIISNGVFELPIISSMYVSFSTISMPLMIQHYNERKIVELLDERKAYQQRVAKLLFPTAAVLFLWAPEIVRLLFGAQYQESAPLFRVFSISFFLRFTSYHDVFMLSGRTKYIGFIQVFELIFHVVITYLAFWYLGIIGASAAAVLTNLMYVLVSSYFSAKILDINIRQLYPWRKLVSYLIFSFLVVLPFFVIKQFFNSDQSALILGALALLGSLSILNGIKTKLI